MTQPTNRDDLARTHIKALIDEAKHQVETAPGPAQMFFSGMLSGLAASGEILDGGTAEKSMELMVQWLSAAIGQAYLDGKLPAQPPAPAGPAAVVTDVGTPVTTELIGATGSSSLRNQIAAVIAREFGPHRGRDYGLLGIVPRLTDALLDVILPTTRITAEIARSAEANVHRVIDLYERWCKAGPPPLGTSTSRWWDERLLELRHTVIVAPDDQPGTPS